MWVMIDTLLLSRVGAARRFVPLPFFLRPFPRNASGLLIVALRWRPADFPSDGKMMTFRFAWTIQKNFRFFRVQPVYSGENRAMV